MQNIYKNPFVLSFYKYNNVENFFVHILNNGGLTTDERKHFEKRVSRDYSS